MFFARTAFPRPAAGRLRGRRDLRARDALGEGQALEDGRKVVGHTAVEVGVLVGELHVGRQLGNEVVVRAVDGQAADGLILRQHGIVIIGGKDLKHEQKAAQTVVVVGLFVKADVIAAVVGAAFGQVIVAPAGRQRDGKIAALAVVIRRAEGDVPRLVGRSRRLGGRGGLLAAAAGGQRQRERQRQHERRDVSFHADRSFPNLRTGILYAAGPRV